jgi:hypothetical protein
MVEPVMIDDGKTAGVFNLSTIKIRYDFKASVNMGVRRPSSPRPCDTASSSGTFVLPS